MFDFLSAPTLEKFTDTLVYACLDMQGNDIYRSSTEDQRNTFIATLLDKQGYVTKDQTRWGISSTGKSAGEIDIYVREKDGTPFTIIEALNLDSVNKEYISLHLKKIFNYDSSGLKQNFILVYSSAVKFAQLWKNYVDYIPKVDYPYEYLEFEEIFDYPFTDIKICKSKHLRNENEIYLFHVVVNMKK